MTLKTPEAFAASRRLFSDSELRKLLNPKLHSKIQPVLDAAVEAEMRKLKSKSAIDRTDELAMNAHAAANNVGYIAPRRHYTTFTPHAHPLFVKAATAIPAELRAWHGIYGPFMKALSPEAAAIPYASEFFPPSYPQKLRTAGRLYVSARRRALRLASHLHPRLMDGYTYIDMHGWWHNVPSWKKAMLGALELENKWLNQDYVGSLVKAQDSGRDLTRKLIRVATFKLACERWCS